MSLRPSEKANARRSCYKVAVDGEEGRRRREEQSVMIRQSKREEILLKKRCGGLQQPHEQLFDEKLQSLQNLVAGVNSNEGIVQLEATTMFREILCRNDAPTDQVIQAGVVPRFVEFLARDDYPQLQLQAAWALTNIVSGTSEHTRVVIDHGAVPILVKLLDSAFEEVREQAVWALGNVAGDSPKYRDFVLSNGALAPLLRQLNEQATLSMLRTATWALSHFCRSIPQQPFEQVIIPALPALRSLIYSDDEEVLTNACFTLSYIYDVANYEIQTLAGVCKRLVELLLHPSPSVVRPALRIIGNIATGDDVQTQSIIDNGALPCLSILLTQCINTFKKEACWLSQTLQQGRETNYRYCDQLAVIEAGLIAPLVNLLQTAELDIKKEAVWAISNAISVGSPDQIKFLVSQGCIKTLSDLLIYQDPKLVFLCLEGLDNLLKVGEGYKNLGNNGGVNYFATLIDEAEGLGKIENLESHDNHEIYEKAVKILETYWSEEDEGAAEENQDAFSLALHMVKANLNH